MSNKGQDLSTERIADYYTSLFHVLCSDIASSPLNEVYDGAGTMTGLSLSALQDRVVINNYIYPEGYDDSPTEWLDAFFPVGVIILTATNNNPSHRIAGTKWCQIDPPGQFLVGIGSSTDENGDVHRFAPHDQQPLNGDLAGEYRHRLTTDELQEHLHVTNAGTVVLAPEGGKPREENTNVGFLYYFGAPVNQVGLVDETSPDGNFLGQDEIQAFQNNASYSGHNKYRDWLIKERQRQGYQYTDEDFSPTLGAYSLASWGPTVAGGPGWAGYLDTTKEFITNSPRPINIPWVLDGQDVTILEGFDQRDQDRVHPGTFTAQQLIIARDYIISVLGAKDATVALENVNRLKELHATVPQAVIGRTTVVAEIPATGHTQSLNDGDGGTHNNIPPNYGIYAWRRVELNHTCGSIEPEVAPKWEATITTNKISTSDVPFNLNEWAKEHVNADNLSWDGEQEAAITIADSVYIYSDDPNDSKVPGMIIGDFPEGLTLINNGFIMGRGGNGGYNSAGFRAGRDGRGNGIGQDGGDAIKLTGSSGEIIIENINGGIGAGGGGGGGAWGGNGSGGGGGAGGGHGGRSDAYKSGPAGGEPGQIGGSGQYWVNGLSKGALNYQYTRGRIVTDGWGPAFDLFPGIGGRAGGSGVASHNKISGWDHNGTGGGGGRILTTTAYGGGTGGMPGAIFGGFKADGTVRDERGDGPPWIDGDVTPNDDTTGWISGWPLSRDGGHKGNAKANGTRGNNRARNYGVVYRRQSFDSSLYSRASINSGDRQGGAYVSATGWNGVIHWSSFVAGGTNDEPGMKNVDIIKTFTNYHGHISAGGGGWGAAGGNGGNGCFGGKGGKAVRVTGSTAYKINGGVVYGSTD